MYYYWWILIIIFTCIIVVFADRFNVNSIKFIFWFTYFSVVILLAVRPENIPDYESYYRAFCRIDQSLLGTNFLIKEYTIGVEYGFIFLIYCFKSVFGTNFRLFLLLLVSMSMFLTVWYMEKIISIMSTYTKKERWINRYLLMGLFYSYIGLQYQGIALRSALSFCFFIIAFYYWIQKKYIKSIILLGIGFTLHRMTLIGFGIIILYTILPHISRKYVRIICYVVVAAALIIYISGNMHFVLSIATQVENYIFTYVNYSHYLSGMYETGVLGNGSLFIMSVIIVTMFLYKGGTVLDTFVVLLGMEIVLILATSNISGAARIYDYFTLLLYPTLVQCVCQRKRQLIYNSLISMIIIVNSIISFRIWGII